MISWQVYMAERRSRINQALTQVLPAITAEPCQLHTAMHYAVLNGGKRLRPLLVYATGETLQADISHLDVPAAAIELIHAYSLVHDDLPAMDDDDLRRGQPTCHKAFDEATAILVGDALQSLAFALLAEAPGIAPKQGLAMIKTLAVASGAQGMVGGQSLDLQAVGQSLTQPQIEKLYQLKTGALLSASVELGILAAPQPDPQLVQALRDYTQHIGLAFQIQDDILDIEGDVTTLGKQPGSDCKSDKFTYPLISGMTAAKTRVQALKNAALSALHRIGKNAYYLQQLTETILN